MAFTMDKVILMPNLAIERRKGSIMNVENKNEQDKETLFDEGC